MKSKSLVLTGGAFVALLALDAALGGAAAQQAATVFTNLSSKASDLYYNVRTIILLICAIAIVATMVSAISGRFPFGKAMTLVWAIIIIGISSEIVTYFASGTTNSSATSQTVPTTALNDTASTTAP